MRILFVASEVAPFSKTGGLADVSGALPVALAALGHEVKVVSPRYAAVSPERLQRLDSSIRLRFPFGEQRLGLYSARLEENCEAIFLEHPGFYGRAGLYNEGDSDYGDNARRFATLSVGALSASQALRFLPDIVHFNDWQTGLGPVALQQGYRHTSLSHAKSVFTVHNLAYQGMFPKHVVNELGLPWNLFTLDGFEFYDQLSFLKAGLTFADALTTVSPRYAQEIQSPEAGWGMDAVLRKRRADLHGILNGIDVREWNPQTDVHLPAHYSPDSLSNKAACKRALLDSLGMGGKGAEERPLFGFIGRLAEQKGIDLLLSALPWLLEHDVRVVMVGSGHPPYEQALTVMAQRSNGRMVARIGFDTALSHRVEAGADFFLMPSLYEPCGLNQMYSLRYGTVPIVRAVGGLLDTVVDVARPEGTGFVFHDYSPDALIGALERALELYSQPKRLETVRKRGMRIDFSWSASARKYVELYGRLLNPGAEKASPPGEGTSGAQKSGDLSR